jgi:SAM-dependent methyltransferase
MADRRIEEAAGGENSMLARIAPLREATEAMASNIHLRTVEGLSEEFRRLLLRHDGHDFPASLEAAGHDMSTLYGLPSAKLGQYGTLLREKPVLDATKTMVDEGATSALYLSAFVQAALLEHRCRMTRDALAQALAGTHPDVSPLVLPGREQGGENNHTFLLQNTYRNYLRLPGIEPPIDYDELHRRHMYRFTHAKEANDFLQEVLAYRNGPRSTEKLIEGKEVLTLGPGRGRDEEQMLISGNAASVDMLEGSPYMLTKLEKIWRGLSGGLQDRFRIPTEPQNMLAALKALATEGRRFDTIYSHSSIHYFNDVTLEELLCDIKACLKPSGHFAFAVKAPGAVLDGNGIPLIQDIETLSSSRGVAFVEERIRNRMWLNFDGQTRTFRDKAVWVELLRKHFAVPRVTEHRVERYETDTQRAQTFYYFLCKNPEEAPARRRRRKA